MNRDFYDLVIVGSGPAGMSVAVESKKINPGFSILMLEKGIIRTPEDREISEHRGSGWGGAGTFSDGKLNLTSKSGGQLADILTPAEFDAVMRMTKYRFTILIIFP